MSNKMKPTISGFSWIRVPIGWAVWTLAMGILFSAPLLAFKLGVNADNWSGQIHNPAFGESLKQMGVQFVVWHLSPEEEISDARLMEIVQFCRNNQLAYLFNTELANLVPDIPHFQQSDGTYRYDLKTPTLEKLKADPLFLGVVYDEPELMQALCGEKGPQGKTIRPYFADTRSSDLNTAFNKVVLKITALNQYYSQYGKRMIFEMVLPDYAHAVARGGALPAPKLLKENFNDLMYAVYTGAALEYQQSELWACIDLWFLDLFPKEGKCPSGGHTSEQLLDALVFSYKQGYDFVYIEQAKALLDGSHHLSSYGQKVVEFQALKSKLSLGDWRKTPADYLVRRFPDGYWGQEYSFFIPNHPYGSQQGDPVIELSKKWLALLNRLSKGVIPAEADTWNATSHPFFTKRQYIALAGLPPMLVFDHLSPPLPGFTGEVIDLTH